jgi:hypothetical protein
MLEDVFKAVVFKVWVRDPYRGHGGTAVGSTKIKGLIKYKNEEYRLFYTTIYKREKGRLKKYI